MKGLITCRDDQLGYKTRFNYNLSTRNSLKNKYCSIANPSVTLTPLLFPLSLLSVTEESRSGSMLDLLL